MELSGHCRLRYFRGSRRFSLSLEERGEVRTSFATHFTSTLLGRQHPHGSGFVDVGTWATADFKTGQSGSNQDRPLGGALFVSGFLMLARAFRFLPATALTAIGSADLSGTPCRPFSESITKYGNIQRQRNDWQDQKPRLKTSSPYLHRVEH